MKRLLLLLILSSTTLTTFSQYRIGLVPRVSPDKSVYQKVGYTDVEVTYGSPSVNNRPVWGNLARFGKVWRAGANNATTVRFGLPVVIDGIALDSGTYALFVMPKKDDKWTVIFSNKSKQWGSFRYDEADDALRADIIPRRTHLYREELEYSIGQTGFQYGSIILAWEHLEIEIPFETNYLDEFKSAVMQSIEQSPEMEHIHWVNYLQGAEHLLETNLDLSTAMTWINEGETIMDQTTKWNDQYYPRPYIQGHLYWTKAKLLAKADQKTEASSYVEKLKSLDNPIFYERENEEEGIDELANQWKE